MDEYLHPLFTWVWLSSHVQKTDYGLAYLCELKWPFVNCINVSPMPILSFSANLLILDNLDPLWNWMFLSN